VYYWDAGCVYYWDAGCVYYWDAGCVYCWDVACVDCWDAARGPGAEPPASLESVTKAGQAKRAPCLWHGFTACLYILNELLTKIGQHFTCWVEEV
jgi:hypothetical protein